MEILGKDKNTREGIAIGNAGNLCTGLPDGNDYYGDNGNGDDGDGDNGDGDDGDGDDGEAGNDDGDDNSGENERGVQSPP